MIRNNVMAGRQWVSSTILNKYIITIVVVVAAAAAAADALFTLVRVFDYDDAIVQINIEYICCYIPAHVLKRGTI